jgi:hypothetical protein
MTHSIAYYEKVIADQAHIINFERARCKQLEDTIANKRIPINMRQATIAIKKLVETDTPDENGWYRAHLPHLAVPAGSSASTMSRAVRNLEEYTGVIEIRKERDKHEPDKEIIYIKPTDLLNHPKEIVTLKDIKRHGGDHRCQCGGELLIKTRVLTCQEYTVCKDCGTTHYLQPRMINTPLQDAMGENEQEEEETDEQPRCNVQPLTVDTVCHIVDGDPIARCNGILEELKSLPVWCAHRGKVPYNVSKDVRSYQKAEPDNKNTWTTFDQAQAIYETSRSWSKPFDGIGFMNTGDYVFTDIDHCRDKDTGELTEDAQALIACLDSYTEASYSGTGIHIIARGHVPRGRKHDGVEMYPAWRFFTFTGQHIAGTPPTISDSQAELDSLYQELFPADIPTPIVPTSRPKTGPISTQKVLEKGKNDIKFMDLFHGTCIGAYYLKKDGVTPDYSRADAALFEKLLYWTDGDVSTSKGLFEQSGLMRDKWNRTDYRESTINKALAMYQHSRRIAS